MVAPRPLLRLPRAPWLLAVGLFTTLLPPSATRRALWVQWPLRRELPPIRSVARAVGTSGELATVIDGLNALKETHPDVFWHWRQFCVDEGNCGSDGRTSFNPKEHPDAVKRFLSKHAEGSFTQVEMASPAQCQKIEDLKATDDAVWWQFAQFCSDNAFGLANPSRIPAEILQRFLTQCADGSMAAVELSTKANAKKLQALRRMGTEEDWVSFCSKHSLGVRDPRKLPADLVERFLLEYTPKPRMQDELKQEMMREKLDELRRLDPSVFWQWRKFCSEHPEGAVDAEAFPEDKIEQFLTRRDSGSIAMVELASEDLCKRLEDLRRDDPDAMWLFAEYSSKEAFGIRSPQLVASKVVQGFLTKHADGSLPPIGEMATQEQVKELTKLKASGSGWWSFCAEHSFGIRDPRRFPATVAQYFLEHFKPRASQ